MRLGLLSDLNVARMERDPKNLASRCHEEISVTVAPGSRGPRGRDQALPVDWIKQPDQAPPRGEDSWPLGFLVAAFRLDPRPPTLDPRPSTRIFPRDKRRRVSAASDRVPS